MKRLIALFVLIGAAAPSAEIQWTHLSSSRGELPVPAGSHQQTGALVADLDGNGTTDFVIGSRVKAPTLSWFRRVGDGWKQFILEKDFLPLEAGGAAHDIDADGDLDIVFGADAQSDELWWWENPAPQFDAHVPWRRHVIKDAGANQHHDQLFADLKGTGRPQLIFWNQRARALLMADIPGNPRSTSPWPTDVIFSGQAGEGVGNAALYAEGLDAFDVDGDGTKDLLAGNYWFKHEGGTRFRHIRVGTIGGRIRAARFRAGGVAQIVIAPGDGSGPLMFYTCSANALQETCWRGRDLLGQPMVHGHTLDVGDVDGDGHLDIFAAEMAKWTNGPAPDHPDAKSWLLFGDGKGGFRQTVFTTGHGWHEGRLADLDGDGDLDVLGKPYTWSAPRVDVWLNNGTRAARSSSRHYGLTYKRKGNSIATSTSR